MCWTTSNTCRYHRTMRLLTAECWVCVAYSVQRTYNAQDVVRAVGEQAGIADLHITGFVRLQCGEGLEKKQANFAEEVAAAAGM